MSSSNTYIPLCEESCDDSVYHDNRKEEEESHQKISIAQIKEENKETLHKKIRKFMLVLYEYIMEEDRIRNGILRSSSHGLNECIFRADTKIKGKSLNYNLEYVNMFSTMKLTEGKSLKEHIESKLTNEFDVSCYINHERTYKGYDDYITEHLFIICIEWEKDKTKTEEGNKSLCCNGKCIIL